MFNPDDDIVRIIQEGLGHSLQDIMRKFSSQIKVLAKDQNMKGFGREKRFQTIHVDLPFDNEEQTIKQWLGKVCKEVFTRAFNAFQNGLIPQDHLKPFCSENLIRNILNLSHHFNLTNKDFQMMNKCLEKDLIPYYQISYPLVQEGKSSVRFAREINQTDHREEAENDLLLKSGIKFAWKESGDYNEQIMRLMNYIIKIQNKKMNELFPQLKDNQETLADSFQKDIEKEFKRIQSKQWIDQWKKYLQREGEQNQSIKFQFKEDPSYFPDDQRKHLQKIGSKYWKAGRKIAEGIQPFQEKDCKDGNLIIKQSSILRILSKWCKQLLQNFDSEYLINKQEMFKMKNGIIKHLQSEDVYFLDTILKYSRRNIKAYEKIFQENNYKQQSEFAKKDISDQLKKFPSEEAMVGEFATVIFFSNQNYIIGYLNLIIHSLMDAIEIYTISKKIDKKNCQSLKNKLYKIENSPDQKFNADEYISRYGKMAQQKNVDHEIPQLITFRIGDLLRSKCESTELEIISLYKYFKYLSDNQSKYLKIIRVKNRLKEDTKDVFLNLIYRETMMVQVQLSIKSKSSKFIQHSNPFRHYLYELGRTLLGPISELCNIWVNKDLRSSHYVNNFQRENQRKIDQPFQQCRECCKTQDNQMKFVLPFTCDKCKLYYYECNYIHPHIYCIQCEKNICGRCLIQEKKFDQFIKKLPEIQLKLRENVLTRYVLRLKDLTLYRQIPTKGIIIALKEKKANPKIFWSSQGFKTQKHIFGRKLNYGQESQKPNFTFIASVKSQDEDEDEDKDKDKDELKKFLNENLIYASESLNRSPLIKEIPDQDLNNQFYGPQFLMEIHKKRDLSINIADMGLEDKMFDYIQSDIKFIYVKNLNMYGNNFTDLGRIIERFPNAQQVMLSTPSKCGKIQSIPDKIKLWGQNLKKLELKNHRITDISQEIGQMKSLIHLNLRDNPELTKLPDSFRKLENLEQLLLDAIKLHKTPKLYNFKKLRILSLSQNKQLKKIYDVSPLEKLEELNIDQCSNLQQFPEGFNQLKSLRIFSGQGIPYQPFSQEINQLTKLQHLRLRGERHQSLSNSFGSLKDLITLDLSNNRLSNLPETFKDLPKLKELNISHNRLTDLPSFRQLHSLKSLNASNNDLGQLNDLPQNLTTLKLRNNKRLQLIRDERNKLRQLGYLAQLDYLDLSNISARQINFDWFNLPRLQNLNLSNNLFQTIQRSSQKLSLRTLYIENSKLQQINFLSFMPKLQRLYINSNNIRNIDPIWSLAHLRTISMNNNPSFSSIPEHIKQLKNLQWFSIEDCPITDVSQELQRLDRLGFLRINKSKLNKQSKDIVQKIMGRINQNN